MISEGAPITYDTKLTLCRSLIYGKQDWLEKVELRKISRPEHEVDRIRMELLVLTAMADDYARAVEVEKARAG